MLLTKILGASLAFIIYSIVIVGTAYYKGTINERNSLENKQKDALIVNQNKIIQQQNQSVQLSNNQLTEYANELNEQAESYSKIKKELANEKELLNRTNHINAMFVRIISANNRTAVSNVSNSTSSINEESSESAELSSIPASRVASYVIYIEYQYYILQLQLNNLIDWVNGQDELYSGK